MTATIYAWITAATLTICMGWLAVITQIPAPTVAALHAAHQDAVALARRDLAAAQVCDGQPFEWLDDKTLVCHREARP